ncbi:hypothetical protein DUI87_20193 [Hirundo rustica rustica]|uniref:Uncharacterized protein n=1 Tax=Hirundo rustica rustica TaxID=333673 RepID=A0A3M0JW37_HIRRU|nr:hypothetical protein DUI87_20193 [Hirundo rustica rustica]
MFFVSLLDWKDFYPAGGLSLPSLHSRYPEQDKTYHCSKNSRGDDLDIDVILPDWEGILQSLGHPCETQMPPVPILMSIHLRTVGIEVVVEDSVLADSFIENSDHNGLADGRMKAEQSMCLGSCTFKSGLQTDAKSRLHKLKLTHLHEVIGAGSLACSFARNKRLATGLKLLQQHVPVSAFQACETSGRVGFGFWLHHHPPVPSNPNNAQEFLEWWYPPAGPCPWSRWAA